MTSEIQQRAARVRLLLMDVDGVLTDGLIYNVPSPAEPHIAETKGFNSQDGIALQWLTWFGIHTGIVSGRVSRAAEVRAEQVGMTYIYQGHIEKLPILEDIIARSGLATEEMAYMGDDLTDLPVMRSVGLALAPSNARPEVKRAAHYVTAAPGGAGAVREVAELLLQARGHWTDILKKYGVE